MHVDECGAPERLAGTKLLTVETATASSPRRRRPLGAQAAATSTGPAARRLDHPGDRARHRLHPRRDRAIADAAHRLGMLLHVDGARLANAAAALGVPPRRADHRRRRRRRLLRRHQERAPVRRRGRFLPPRARRELPFTRKQLGQLASKMRFISAQFEALLADDLWLRSARHANEMAARLAAAVEAIDGVEITPPGRGERRLRAPRRAGDRPSARELRASTPSTSGTRRDDEVRWMCAWDTTARTSTSSPPPSPRRRPRRPR